MTHKIRETYTLTLSREEIDMLNYSLEITVREALKNGDYSFTSIIADLRDEFFKMIHHE